MIDYARRAELTDELGEEFLEELTAAFWTDAWALLDFGVSALVRDDKVEIGKVLHTLTGASRNLGYSAIAEASIAAQAELKAGAIPDFGGLQAVMLRTLAAEDGTEPSASAQQIALSA